MALRGKSSMTRNARSEENIKEDQDTATKGYREAQLDAELKKFMKGVLGHTPKRKTCLRSTW
jgi:hypothetical protein